GAEVAGVVVVNVGDDLVDFFGGGVREAEWGVAVTGDGAGGVVLDHELEDFEQPDHALHGRGGGHDGKSVAGGFSGRAPEGYALFAPAQQFLQCVQLRHLRHGFNPMCGQLGYVG